MSNALLRRVPSLADCPPFMTFCRLLHEEEASKDMTRLRHWLRNLRDPDQPLRPFPWEAIRAVLLTHGVYVGDRHWKTHLLRDSVRGRYAAGGYRRQPSGVPPAATAIIVRAMEEDRSLAEIEDEVCQAVPDVGREKVAAWVDEVHGGGGDAGSDTDDGGDTVPVAADPGPAPDVIGRLLGLSPPEREALLSTYRQWVALERQRWDDATSALTEQERIRQDALREAARIRRDAREQLTQVHLHAVVLEHNEEHRHERERIALEAEAEYHRLLATDRARRLEQEAKLRESEVRVAVMRRENEVFHARIALKERDRVVEGPPGGSAWEVVSRASNTRYRGQGSLTLAVLRRLAGAAGRLPDAQTRAVCEHLSQWARDPSRDPAFARTLRPPNRLTALLPLVYATTVDDVVLAGVTDWVRGQIHH